MVKASQLDDNKKDVLTKSEKHKYISTLVTVKY